MNAQTNVSGLISTNTVWTLANSPYIVTGNILVNNGVTLTIEPGVTVKFDSLKALQINGQLTARGNSGNYITFTSNKSAPANGYWGYIFFSDASADAVFDVNGNYTGGSIMEYCIVECAGIGANNYGAVEMNSSYPFINYCTIRNNNISGIYANNLSSSLKITNNLIHHNTRYCSDGDGGGGIFTSGGTVTIAHNTIRDNSVTYHGYGGGIFSKDGTAIITDNTISNNTTPFMSVGGGTYVLSYNYMTTITNNIISGNTAGEFSIYSLYGPATISNNIISNNVCGGIMIYYGSGIITNNYISGNTAGYAGGGIYIRDAAANISNNVISDNAVSYDISYDRTGGGIYLAEAHSGLRVTVTKNSIIRNSAKNVSALDYPINEYGSSYDSVNIAYNTITGNKATNVAPSYTNRISYVPLFNLNNIFKNTATYELYNANGNASQNLNAKNNWWGTTADAEIQGKIYDWFDDASLGIVDYSSYLTALDTSAPVSPPVNVIKTNLGGGQIRISWNPNQEGDIAGYHIYYGGFNGYSFANIIDAGNSTSYTLTGVSLSDTIWVTAYDKSFSVANENSSTIVNDNMTNGNESCYSYAVAGATGVSDHGNEIAKIYTLQQNYPNPFNPSTNISFTLPYQSHVSLKVFDILGKEVATLVNEVKAAGSYTRQWNASQFTSGVYFYRLTAGLFFETKKLLLLR